MRRLVLLALAACTSGSTRVFELKAAAPSLIGLVETPACVVTATDVGAVACVSSLGSIRWHTEVCHPLYQRPALVGGSLFIACESGEWTALDVKTGRARWKLSGRRVPAAAVVSDGLHGALASADGTVEGVDEAGTTLWTAPGAGTRVWAGGEAIAATGDGGLAVLDAATGVRRFSDPSPAIALTGSDTQLFAARAGGDVVAWDLRTGQKAWGVTLGALVPDALGADADAVIAGLQSGDVVELAAADGAERRRTRLGKPLAAPVRYGVAVLQGREGCAVTLKGEPLGCADHQLRGSAVVRDGVLMLGPRDGRVLGFRLKQP